MGLMATLDVNCSNDDADGENIFELDDQVKRRSKQENKGWLGKGAINKASNKASAAGRREAEASRCVTIEVAGQN